jgi:hypothetical protein
MTQFGYAAMGEQTPARRIPTDLVAAGRARARELWRWAAQALLPALRKLG